MKNTLDYLKNKLNNNDTIVIACSGGPDSMFLLRILLQLRTSKKLNLICAHVNHNLREQSIEEYNYVKQFCNQNNIEFEYIPKTENTVKDVYVLKKKREKPWGLEILLIITNIWGFILFEQLRMRKKRERMRLVSKKPWNQFEIEDC